MGTTDGFGRPLRNLRISVTDRCNLRCHYCMPETEYVWLPREDLLTFEEIDAARRTSSSALGVDRVRLTGGEPLLRRDLPADRAARRATPALEDLALTTNGVLLADAGRGAASAPASHRVTVSLDTLDRDRFLRLTRVDELDAVLAGIDAARAPASAGSRSTPSSSAA